MKIRVRVHYINDELEGFLVGVTSSSNPLTPGHGIVVSGEGEVLLPSIDMLTVIDKEYLEEVNI